jgi:hypothetical protein
MAPSQTWNRRSFLQLVGFGGVAVALPASLRLGSLIDSQGQPCHPGAVVALQVAADAPQRVQVRLATIHAGVRLAAPAEPAAAGGLIHLETPYPYADLVPGEYHVEGELLSADGAVLARLAIGSYRVRPWRFSA